MMTITGNVALGKAQQVIRGDWLAADADGPLELIVEVAIPATQVAFRKIGAGRLAPSQTVGESAASRDQMLGQVRTFLLDLLGSRPTVLKAAGALVVRATPGQARQILDHPLVSTVRPNRLHRSSC